MVESTRTSLNRVGLIFQVMILPQQEKLLVFSLLVFFSWLDRWNKNFTDFKTEKMRTARKRKNFRKN